MMNTLKSQGKNTNEEICYAIEKADGYYYDYVLEMLIERGIKNKQFH